MLSFTLSENKLYVVYDTKTMRIYMFDPVARPIGSVVCEENVDDWFNVKLVITNGKLLIIVRTRNPKHLYKLYKLEKKRWISIRSLGDRVQVYG